MVVSILGYEKVGARHGCIEKDSIIYYGIKAGAPVHKYVKFDYERFAEEFKNQ